MRLLPQKRHIKTLIIPKKREWGPSPEEKCCSRLKMRGEKFKLRGKCVLRLNMCFLILMEWRICKLENLLCSLKEGWVISW